MEVLVEGCIDSEQALAALKASSEEDWLKTFLGCVVLGHAFAVDFARKEDADTFADRIRSMGFRCRVWEGPAPSQRVQSNR